MSVRIYIVDCMQHARKSRGVGIVRASRISVLKAKALRGGTARRG